MTNAELPTTVVGLISLALITMGGIWRVRSEQRSQGKQVAEVHNQIRNDHPQRPNMRDDLDDMASNLKSGFADIRADIRGLRKDISGLHGAVGSVRRELHTEIDRSTAADELLSKWITKVVGSKDEPPRDSTR